MRNSTKRNKVVGGRVNLAWVNPTIEIFYDIPGWPGYKISNMKNVWSEKSNKVLKQYQTYPGKPQMHVFLSDAYGKSAPQNVQKLFWKTFYRPKFLEKM